MTTQVVTDSGESCLELLADAAVDEEVRREVDHHQQVGHGLQAHHPQRGDVLGPGLAAAYLDVCKHKKLFYNF